MTLAVDASVAVRWFVRQPGSEAADAVLGSGDQLIAPDLVVAEVGNALWKYLRASLMSADAAGQAQGHLAVLFDELVPLAELATAALAAARELGHPIYDCFYLVLAHQRDCRLVTADQRLLTAVRRTRWAGRTVALARFAP